MVPKGAEGPLKLKGERVGGGVAQDAELGLFFKMGKKDVVKIQRFTIPGNIIFEIIFFTI